jgi:hypothetical protein
VSFCSALALVVSGWTLPAAAQSTSSHRVGASGLLAAHFTSASITNAEKVLAQSGIATVAEESSTKPLVKVAGAVRITFTQPQVRAMALGAAEGSGVSGAAPDAAAPVATGDIPLSYLLASWVSTEKTPAALAIRKLMGTQDWKDAPAVVFPTIALPLFVGDVIAASASQAASTPSDIANSADADPNRTPTSVDLTGLSDSPCSTVSNFIDSTLNAVINALMLNAPTGAGVGAKIGTFFVGLWNGALVLAQAGISGLITVVTAPVVSAIQTVAAAATVITAVVSYLTPWSVQVTPAPGSVNAGDGGIVNAAVNDGSGGTDYPSSISNCAGSLSPPVTLPTLSSAKSDATWTLAGAISADGATNVKLDEHGKSDINYKTTSTTSSPSCAKASSSTCRSTDTSSNSCTASGNGSDQSPTPTGDTGTAMITITRPGVDALKNLVSSMITSSLGLIGGVAGGVVRSLVEPLLQSALAPLADLLKVTGTGYVTVNPTSSTTSSTPKSTTSTTASCAPCLVGSWTQTNETNTGNPVLVGFSGGTGMKLTITPTGTFTEDWNGSAPLVSPGGGSLAYTGTEGGTVQLPTDPSATSGPFVIGSQTGSITADLNGRVSSFAAAGSISGTWTCQGDALTLTVPDGGAGTNNSTLSRAGS